MPDVQWQGYNPAPFDGQPAPREERKRMLSLLQEPGEGLEPLPAGARYPACVVAGCTLGMVVLGLLAWAVSR